MYSSQVKVNNSFKTTTSFFQTDVKVFGKKPCWLSLTIWWSIVLIRQKRKNEEILLCIEKANGIGWSDCVPNLMFYHSSSMILHDPYTFASVIQACIFKGIAQNKLKTCLRRQRRLYVEEKCLLTRNWEKYHTYHMSNWYPKPAPKSTQLLPLRKKIKL